MTQTVKASAEKAGLPIAMSPACSEFQQVKNKNYTEDFIAFWKEYRQGVKRGSKQGAYKVWIKLNAHDRDIATRAIPYYFREAKDPKYRKHASTYLNKREFEFIYELFCDGKLDPVREKEEVESQKATDDEVQEVNDMLKGLI